jgi:hypothetical protein
MGMGWHYTTLMWCHAAWDSYADVKMATPDRSRVCVLSTFAVFFFFALEPSIKRTGLPCSGLRCTVHDLERKEKERRRLVAVTSNQVHEA